MPIRIFLFALSCTTLPLAGCTPEEPTDTEPAPEGSGDTGGTSGDTGAAPASGWSTRFGGELFDAAVAAASNGDAGQVVMTGRYATTITFGDHVLTSPGGSRAFLAALDGDGRPEWARDMGDAFVWDVVTDASGNVLVTARTYETLSWGPDPTDELACCHHLAVGKFTRDGAHVFSVEFEPFLPNSANRSSAIAVDASDAVYLTGSVDRDFLVGGFVLRPEDQEDAWVIKLDPTGDVVWATAISGASDERPTGIAVDSGGTVYVAGTFDGTVTAGASTVTAATAGSLFLARIDASGTPVDVVGFDTRIDGDLVVVADGDGILLGGGFELDLDLGSGPLPFGGDTDAFVARFTDELVVDWATAFGDSLDQRVADLERDAAGRIWLTGTARGTLDFGSGEQTTDVEDLFVARLDGTTLDLARLYGGPEDQYGRGIVVDPRGGVVVVGDGSGGLDFGHGPLVSAGGADVFVGRIDPDPR